MNFRVMYVKNVILLAYLDDPTQSTLTSLLFSNNLTIVGNLSENEAFMNDLFEKLRVLAPMAHLKPKANGNGITNGHGGSSSSSSSSPSHDMSTPSKGAPSSSSSSSSSSSAGSSSSSSSGAEGGAEPPSMGTTAGSPSLASRTASESPYSPVPVSGAASNLDGSPGEDDNETTLPIPVDPSTSNSGREGKKKKMVIVESFEERKATFLFLQELCNIARTLQINVRQSFYNVLDQQGVFDVLLRALRVSDHLEQHWLWLCCADVLTAMLNHNPSSFRSYVVAQRSHWNTTQTRKSSSTLTATQSPDKVVGSQTATTQEDENGNDGGGSDEDDSFIGLLFGVMLRDRCPVGLIHQLAQILRMLMDSEPVEENGGDAFVRNMFAHHVPTLVTCISSPSSTAMAKYHALELLSFCALHHFYPHMKDLVRGEAVLKAMRELVAANKPNSQLVCAVLRFLRRIVTVGDQELCTLIADSRVLTPIVQCFLANGARYNLLNSVVLSFIDCLVKENIVPCIEYLVSEHGDDLRSVQYVSTYTDLAELYAENKEHGDAVWGAQRNNSDMGFSPRKGGSDARADFGDQNSHNYFETGWEYEDNSGARAQLFDSAAGELEGEAAKQGAGALFGGDDGDDDDDDFGPAVSFKRRADDEVDFADLVGKKKKRHASSRTMGSMAGEEDLKNDDPVSSYSKSSPSGTPPSSLNKLGLKNKKSAAEQFAEDTAEDE
jgi:hypothetical protein